MVSFLNGSASAPRLLSKHFANTINSFIHISTRYQTTSSAYSSAISTAAAFSYQLSSAFCAKGRPFDPIRDSYHHKPPSSSSWPAQSKQPIDNLARRSLRHKSGQDAFFTSEIGTSKSGYLAFGVADGVGGWADSGIDPSDFSHGLCEYMIAHATSQSDPSTATPLMILQPAYEDVLSDRFVVAGGSTACLGIVTPDGELRVGK
jgi:protein phosphatase PTC7